MVTIVVAACATALYGQNASSRAHTQKGSELTESSNIEPDRANATLPRELLHELKQPLNVIRLATDNIRVRILPLLESDDAGYLEAKLDRIERQIYRAASLWDIGADAGEPLATAPPPSDGHAPL